MPHRSIAPRKKLPPAKLMVPPLESRAQATRPRYKWPLACCSQQFRFHQSPILSRDRALVPGTRHETGRILRSTGHVTPPGKTWLTVVRKSFARFRLVFLDLRCLAPSNKQRKKSFSMSHPKNARYADKKRYNRVLRHRRRRRYTLVHTRNVIQRIILT